MKNKILAIVTVTIALIFMPVLAYGNSTVCVSYFAAQAFNQQQCNDALKVFNNVDTPCMAILWNTFTIKQNNFCTQKFLSRFADKPHILEIHFSNEAGRRNRRLARYEFGAALSTSRYNSNLERGHRGTNKLVQKNAEAIKKFIDTFGNKNSIFLVSAGLEDNFTTKAYTAIFKLIRDVFEKSVLIVRNPVGEHEQTYIGANYIELHGLNPVFKEASHGRCIANLDGISIRFHDGARSQNEAPLSAIPGFIETYREQACLVFLWWNEPQGISATFKDPRSRKFLIEKFKVNLINNLIRRFDI